MVEVAMVGINEANILYRNTRVGRHKEWDRVRMCE